MKGHPKDVEFVNPARAKAIDCASRIPTSNEKLKPSIVHVFLKGPL